VDTVSEESDNDGLVEVMGQLSERLEPSSEPDYVEAWEAEIADRLGQYERGEVKGIPRRQVIENLGLKSSDGK